jgi:hypothetical protein
MAYGCVYQVTTAPPGSEWQLDEIVVLTCESPCVEKTMLEGPNAGCVLTPLSDECMEYPPVQ